MVTQSKIDWDADETNPTTAEPEQSTVNWDEGDVQPSFLDRLTTETLKLGKNTVTGLYELGADFYNLTKSEQERNKDLSIWEQGKDVLKTAKSFAKGSLSANTFGYYEGGEPEDERDRVVRELGQFFGYGKVIQKGSQLFKNAIKGFTPKSLQNIASIGFAMGGYNATQQVQEQLTGKRENLDAAELLSHVTIGAAIPAAIESTPAGAKFLNDLRPSQKLKTLKGQIPPDLPPSSYRMLVDEVVPEMRQIFMDELKTETETARNNLQNEYQQMLSENNAEYSKYIDELMKENRLNEASYNKGEEQLNKKNAEAQTQYQEELQRIEAENAQTLQEFEQANQQWDQYVEQNKRIEEAIEMRARHDNTNDVGFREAAQTETVPTTRNTVGNIISSNEITNPTDAGRSLQSIVRQTAVNERKPVNELYNKSEQLNGSVEEPAIPLAHWIEEKMSKLEEIPSKSGPTKQLLSSYEQVLQAIAELDENGNIIAYKPISNKILLDQAKELRNKVDFDFEAGNPTKIFKDFIEELQNQAERAALESGNEAAYQANIDARTAHRQWKNRYDHDYIRQLRDESVRDYQSAFDKSLKIDNYQKIEPILKQSNPGGNLLTAIQREAVQDQLKPAIENPGRFDAEARQLLLRDLEPITTPEQRTALNDTLKIARKEAPAQPKAPKLKEPPKKPTLKEATPPEEPKQPKALEVPQKPKLKQTPHMRYLEKQLGITPEQLYKEMDTPTGIDKVKKVLSKTEKGRDILKTLEKNEVKDIIYGEKIAEPKTGKEIYDRVNKKANYDKLVEWIGQEAADTFLEKAKEIGDKPAPLNEFEKLYRRDRLIKLLSWSAGVLFNT